jgi:uncharacterized protein YqfA (UPF0365 family)
MNRTSKPLRTATYVLRFTEEEKKELEAKVERAAAEGEIPLTLAHALRMGAKAYLDEMLTKLQDGKDARRDDVAV